ncbi:hypothetical protein [Achromobacter sp. MFA1 R4]|uniref:hypothetical protein n=1 Tax=Achromobacter sp. MFA1 R4 TaxID=1881016 RepID=UPI00095370D1|nr:hypothetical protein [Achromobacter sp. MFA1 R4]SIT28071.1 hypothetical protein SAMN05428937_3796 [Achromobacter sp. MFA1 R4]SIT33410.1 hypothetical protein SAMN05428937_5731 [Achromobacter sp. MFA1 R4]
MNALNTYQHSLLSELIARHIPFLVVGGWAVYLHGIPERVVPDLDIWISPKQLDPGEMTEALVACNVPEDKARAFCRRLQDEGDERPKGCMKPPFSIDIIVRDLEGAKFSLAISRQASFKVQGLTLPVIGFDDLLAVKSATEGAKHQNDAQALRTLRATDQSSDAM